MQHGATSGQPEFHAVIPPRRRRGRRIAKIAATVTALALVLGAAGGWYLVQHYSANIERVDAGITASAASATGAAQNVLVIGSDTRKGLSKKQRAALSTGSDECDCTDTIMLVQMREDTDGATVVSFPRDLMVTVPAYTDTTGARHDAATRQINTAYALGGAKLVVRTVESLTGVQIDHFVQVRFAGVVDVVDAIGGVDVCVTKSFHDTNTHLALAAGNHTLDGVEALKYVRLRHVGDGSDLSRIQRQQQFVVNLLGAATSASVLTNPLKLNRLLSATTSSFVVDEGFSTTDMLSLANRLRTMDRSKLVLLTVPNEAYAPDPNRVQLQQPQADALFAKLLAERTVRKKAAEKSSTSTHARSGTSSACSTPI